MRKITELIEDYTKDKYSAPGISLALTKDGKCVHKESHGFSNLENKVKIDSKTNFYLASLAKSFTAVAVMFLYEKGVLDIYDNIREYFPGLPNKYNDIKVINLLNHTSGLEDYFGCFIEKDKLSDATNKDIYNFICREDNLKFKVGTKFEYSNTGYVLLSMLIEKVVGTSFSDFLQQNILNPLGMTNTYVFTEDKPIIPNRAYGYKEKNHKYLCDDYSILTTGDGGIYSNIDDLILWEKTFNTDLILSKESRDIIYSVEKLNNCLETNYSFGWFISNINNKKIISHDGGAFGFTTFIGKSIEDNFSMIILTNCYKNMWEKIYKESDKIILELSKEI